MFLFHKLVKLYFMNKTWKEINIQVGYEFKTAQQLDALGIIYKMPIKDIIVNDLKTIQLIKNGSILAYIDKHEELVIKSLPYVLSTK